MPDYYQGYWDEARLRGAQAPPDTGYVPDVTPMATNTYTNGNTFAGTGSRSNPGGGNVPMSDAAYRLVSNNGTQAIPTDRDVLGGGKFGVRGWMNDHPVGVMAAFIAAAAGGAALSPAAGGGAGAGAGAAPGAAAAGEGAAAAGAGAGAGAGGAAGAAAGALPEIVVTGTIPAGISAGEAAAIGAGAAGAGAASGGNAPTDYGNYGGWQANSDPVGSLANTQYGGSAGQLASSGGIQGGAGAFGGQLGQYYQQYGDLVSDLAGGLGGGGGGAAPMAMPSMGGMMGSQPIQQASRKPAQLDMSQTRFKGYGRTPLQFRGNTIWL